jgi:hypothetical protein
LLGCDVSKLLSIKTASSLLPRSPFYILNTFLLPSHGDMFQRWRNYDVGVMDLADLLECSICLGQEESSVCPNLNHYELADPNADSGPAFLCVKPDTDFHLSKKSDPVCIKKMWIEPNLLYKVIYNFNFIRPHGHARY